MKEKFLIGNGNKNVSVRDVIFEYFNLLSTLENEAVLFKSFNLIMALLVLRFFPLF